MNDLKDTLWKAADKLRGSLPASQYKDVVLGLVFLQYVSDAHWKSLRDNAKAANIGQLIDQSMRAVMAGNPALAGMLPQLYANVDQRRLGELVALLDNAPLNRPGPRRAHDLLGEVYEYFLGNFARTEGRRGGEFFTPPSVVQVIVEVLQPASGRVYDPCCGSGGMFVQTEQFIVERDGDPQAVSIFGQESVEETWRMAKMNLAIHGIDNAGLVRGDTFVDDRHSGVQMDFVLANPPFNIKDWARDEQDPRWRFGIPPAGNANFAWIQHILSKLSPDGKAGVVMANGSMSSNASGEGDIRARIVEADLVSCMVALPGQLFRSTGIPVCLWFFDMNKIERSGQVLFIDARSLGHLVDRTERVLTRDEVARIGEIYHSWRGYTKGPAYQDIPGFCRTATLDEIRAAGYVLTPGRYVGAAAAEDDGEPVAEKIAQLKKELLAALDESASLDKLVREQLERA
ncbi:restriction endonuclease subunit M [Mycobacterium sp. 852002-51163_SCH5372311]|uniref:class I SAM-dependent DNA methyltransferase n=1 Tax=Mycobacterium sp. 852002-51163_SCH5372311 TaxID=1834097 RepID=UPI0007FDEF8D|nr:type I restriction-modification system subunit M [Mycobacterium sp. 852002-51163_SCH5372311]OBF83922.1 restriction endonuclease subunit M [Mycobacterium sp. 852002-51163_SCH5372311]